MDWLGLRLRVRVRVRVRASMGSWVKGSVGVSIGKVAC